ncbi:hypothetical protein [Chondromyces crocatus]|nr:hypothetical protein [Chondromyces crocatus]
MVISLLVASCSEDTSNDDPTGATAGSGGDGGGGETAVGCVPSERAGGVENACGLLGRRDGDENAAEPFEETLLIPAPPGQAGLRTSGEVDVDEAAG